MDMTTKIGILVSIVALGAALVVALRSKRKASSGQGGGTPGGPPKQVK